MGIDTGIRQVIGGIGRDGGRPAASDGEELDLARLLNLAWRSKWLVAAAACVGMALALLHLQRVVPLYTTETRLLWEVEEQSVTGLDSVVGGLSSDFMLLSSQMEVVTSGRLMGRVVDELKLTEDPDFNPYIERPVSWTAYISPLAWPGLLMGLFASGDAVDPVRLSEAEIRQTAIDMLRASIMPSWEDGTYVLGISATATDAEKAALLANTVARLYILDQLQTKYEATRQATDWLTERVADLRIELEAAESKVEAFNSGTTLVSEEALGALSRQVKELREREQALGRDAEQAAAARTAAETAWAAGDYSRVGELVRDVRIARLADQAEAATGEARTALVARLEPLYDKALERLRLDAERAHAQQRTIATSVAELEARIETQSGALVEQRQLVREAEASRLIYEFFLGRLKEISVQEGIHQADARVLTEARVPWFPSYPRRLRTIVLGALIGMVGGIGLALILERRNTSFRTARDVEAKTGTAVIGQIPIAPVGARNDVLAYLVEKPQSGMAEAVRNLRTSILLANVDKPPQIVMTTSSLPEEGKSTCCVALAQISRAMGKKVLVIECDIRRRTFRQTFGLKGKAGLLSVLSKTCPFEDAVEYHEQSGLYVLPGEASDANAADIFASQRFGEFLTEMRTEFDFIFIDTPPVLAVPDARVIARKADAVAFVIRWNQTPREVVQEALRLFEQTGVRMAGVVLSRVNPTKLARYGSSYGRYYRQAGKYYTN